MELKRRLKLLFVLAGSFIAVSYAGGDCSYSAERAVIDKAAKKAGYKGVFDIGIARFLYKVKHGAQLKDGLNYVFWSKISAKDAKADALFEAYQLVDEVIIYSLSEYSSSQNELINFTIMVPKERDDLFLEGQHLRSACHAYTGNVEYVTIFGVKRTVPFFKPVCNEVCR